MLANSTGLSKQVKTLGGTFDILGMISHPFQLLLQPFYKHKVP